MHAASLMRILGNRHRLVPDAPRRILFFKIGALGDVLMTTPLVRAVAKRFPEATIDYACGASFVAAVRANSHIANVFSFDERAFLRRRFWQMFPLALRLRENRYDLIFVLDKHWGVGAFARFLGGTTVGFDREGEGRMHDHAIPYNNKDHEISQYLRLGASVGAKPAGMEIDMAVSAADLNFARRAVPRKPYIVLVPGGSTNPGESRGAARRWPVAQWTLLAKELTPHCTVVLVGSADERPVGVAIAQVSGALNRMGCTLAQSAAIMKRADWIVSSDSGAMHLASAVNPHIIALFGPTHPRRKAPLHREAIVIWKDQDRYEGEYEYRGTAPSGVFFERLRVDDVLRVLRRRQAI